MMNHILMNNDVKMVTEIKEKTVVVDFKVNTDYTNLLIDFQSLYRP